MERVTLNVERLHLGIADLDALFVSARVVVAAISSTTAMRSMSGRPRQVCVMWQNKRCSIRFHFRDSERHHRFKTNAGLKIESALDAVYTRVSTDTGLEQDFNSLDNQREASEAYIKSQAHEGWKLVRGRYDDGGSGAREGWTDVSPADFTEPMAL